MRRRPIILTALLSSLLLLAGVSPAFSESAKSDPSADLRVKAEPVTATIDAAAARANEVATAHSALGTYYDPATKELVVVVGPKSDITTTDAELAIGAAVRVEQRDITPETVAAIQDRLASRSFADEAEGHSYASFLDLRTGNVVLMTDAPEAAIEPLMKEFPERIDLRKEQVHDDFSRTSDVPPFWGGASVTSGGFICSTGFVVRKGSTRFMLTAGHCFSLGASVTTTGGGLSEGNVVQRGPIPPFDMELMGGRSYGSFIFVGGTSSSSAKHVNGAGDPVVGFNDYCRSGQTTGERCGQTVSSVNAQLCTQTGCKSPVIAYDGGSAGASALGDSGAPFYVHSVDGSQVFARGIHIASGGTTSFAEEWSRISSHLGVSIQT
jgi:hypothetical protein